MEVGQEQNSVEGLSTLMKALRTAPMEALRSELTTPNNAGF